MKSISKKGYSVQLTDQELLELNKVDEGSSPRTASPKHFKTAGQFAKTAMLSPMKSTCHRTCFCFGSELQACQTHVACLLYFQSAHRTCSHFLRCLICLLPLLPPPRLTLDRDSTSQTKVKRGLAQCSNHKLNRFSALVFNLLLFFVCVFFFFCVFFPSTVLLF